MYAKAANTTLLQGRVEVGRRRLMQWIESVARVANFHSDTNSVEHDADPDRFVPVGGQAVLDDVCHQFVERQHELVHKPLGQPMGAAERLQPGCDRCDLGQIIGNLDCESVRYRVHHPPTSAGLRPRGPV